MSASDTPRSAARSSRDRGHGLRSSPRGPALARLPLGARRATELGAVAAREMRWRLEAAGSGDVDDRHRSLQQELTGPTQPQLQVVALRHAIQVPLEQPLDLP